MDSIYYFFTPVLAYVFRPIYNFLTSFGVPENYLIAILVFPVFWELDGIWISNVVAEALAVILTLLFVVIRRKKYRYF